MLNISNNTDLPEAPAYQVKSFWLLLVTVLITACNALGFDLAASLCEVGLGCTADDIGAKAEHAVGLVQQLLPIITAVWLWFERRAPNFRLVFWRPAAPRKIIGLLWGVLAIGLLLISAPQAMAGGQCLPPQDLHQMLTRYGETVQARSLTGVGRPALLYVNRTTGTWTLIAAQGDQACVIAIGTDWQTSLSGEPT